MWRVIWLLHSIRRVWDKTLIWGLLRWFIVQILALQAWIWMLSTNYKARYDERTLYCHIWWDRFRILVGAHWLSNLAKEWSLCSMTNPVSKYEEINPESYQVTHFGPCMCVHRNPHTHHRHLHTSTRTCMCAHMHVHTQTYIDSDTPQK